MKLLKTNSELTERAIKVTKAAKKASAALLNCTAEDRTKALWNILEALLNPKNMQKVMDANTHDFAVLNMFPHNDARIRRIDLTEKKRDRMIKMVDSVRCSKDPIFEKMSEKSINFDGDRIYLEQLKYPLGVVFAIFEARPDALLQIACLCIRTGNAVILKGGIDAINTNEALVALIKKATKGILPNNWIQTVDKELVFEILKRKDEVDIAIPRGSGMFVKEVQTRAEMPVLGHSEGVCHIFVDRYADFDLALNTIVHAKCDNPSACNAVESILVDERIAKRFLPRLKICLSQHNVKVWGCQKACNLMLTTDVLPEKAYNAEWLEFTVSVIIVKDINKAIEHINKYGSHHTDCIITKNETHKDLFSRSVDSGSVFCNVSTRFADGYNYGLGAEIGISTGKLHARGPVGAEGLLTYKWLGNNAV